MLKNAGMIPSVWETRNAVATDVDIPVGNQVCQVRQISQKASSQNVFNFGIVIGVIAKEIFAMCNKKKEFFDFLLDLYTFSVL